MTINNDKLLWLRNKQKQQQQRIGRYTRKKERRQERSEEEKKAPYWKLSRKWGRMRKWGRGGGRRVEQRHHRSAAGARMKARAPPSPTAAAAFAFVTLTSSAAVLYPAPRIGRTSFKDCRTLSAQASQLEKTVPLSHWNTDTCSASVANKRFGHSLSLSLSLSAAHTTIWLDYLFVSPFPPVFQNSPTPGPYCFYRFDIWAKLTVICPVTITIKKNKREIINNPPTVDVYRIGFGLDWGVAGIRIGSASRKIERREKQQQTRNCNKTRMSALSLAMLTELSEMDQVCWLLSV